MKTIFIILLTLLSFDLFACEINQVRVWSAEKGYACVERYHKDLNDCVLCQGAKACETMDANWFANFPKALYQTKEQPWWATQGNLLYPNLNAPGAWTKDGIDSQYYPGQGEVHALKPNIYIESIHDDKKFNLAFTSKSEDLNFLSTTPALDEKNSWQGKIVNKDRFEVDGINYDYLFYDLRLPKEKMQFIRGQCSTREDAIKWMLEDLKDLKYPAIALQDFEEHWKVKIPDYPFFCIYPQYNAQLDYVLPVEISIEQVQFTRALYVMIPHREEPDAERVYTTPLPTQDTSEFRPQTLIRYENMFKEWGVAFLSE